MLLRVLLLIAISSYCAAAETHPPNIVLIMADDVSPDMFSCFNDRTPHQGKFAGRTPNVDAFVRNGVVFETAYAAAMCLPSRVSIMTGKYGATTGVIRNSTYLSGDLSIYNEHLTFARMLRQAGYATAIAGKWHAGRQMPWEEAVGFDEYCLWEGPKHIEALGNKFDPVSVAWENEETVSRYWQPGLLRNGKQWIGRPDDYGPEMCASFLIEFIKRRAKSGMPFLAYWPSVAPHGTRGGMPTTPLRGKVGDLGSAEDTDRKERFTALVEYLDVQIGRIRSTIHELGIEEETLLIFCSDNATAGSGKTTGVERGCHVVFMVEGAGTKVRGFTKELMDFTDIPPTLADYAGIATPAQNIPWDGQSLQPFLHGASNETKRMIQGYMLTSQTFRTKRYLLEAVNPAMGVPNGRFYWTGDNRFWKGYERAENMPEHAEAYRAFDSMRVKYPPFQIDHPFFSTKKGKAFVKRWMTGKEAVRHLTNSEAYRFYDQSY